MLKKDAMFLRNMRWTRRDVGGRLQAWRLYDGGSSLYDFAGKIGVTIQALEDCENAEKNVDKATVNKIAKYFGVDMSTIAFTYPVPEKSIVAAFLRRSDADEYGYLGWFDAMLRKGVLIPIGGDEHIFVFTDPEATKQFFERADKCSIIVRTYVTNSFMSMRPGKVRNLLAFNKLTIGNWDTDVVFRQTNTGKSAIGPVPQKNNEGADNTVVEAIDPQLKSLKDLISKASELFKRNAEKIKSLKEAIESEKAQHSKLLDIKLGCCKEVRSLTARLAAAKEESKRVTERKKFIDEFESFINENS